MRRRIAVGLTSPKFVKDVLQLISPGNHNAHADGSKIKQQTKIVQIAVVERVLVVPLNFQGDPVLEAVDLVRWRVEARAINFDCSLELLLRPPTLRQEAVNVCRKLGLIAAASYDP